MTYQLSSRMRQAIQEGLESTREQERAHQKKLESTYDTSGSISRKIAIGSIFPMVLGLVLEGKGMKGALSACNNYSQLPGTLGRPFQDAIQGQQSTYQSELQHDRLNDQSAREDGRTVESIEQANKSAFSQLCALLPQALRGN